MAIRDKQGRPVKCELRGRRDAVVTLVSNDVAVLACRPCATRVRAKGKGAAHG